MGVMIEGIYHTDDPGPDTVLNGAFERSRLMPDDITCLPRGTALGRIARY
jgi:hypothetical protein